MLRAHQLLLAKDGLRASECEDAVGVRLDLGRVCVADGATEAFDSRSWARLLTKHWVRSTGLLRQDEMETWWAALGLRLLRRWAGRKLPWYAEEKAASGAFAAFVGVSFAEVDSGECMWTAVALGDACLVHKRDGCILQSIPIGDPSAFGYHPRLVPSAIERQRGLAEDVMCADGMVRPGDRLLLLTDAIAAWYLRQSAETPVLVQTFERLLEENALQELHDLIAAERGGKRLRNDDVAAVLVYLARPTSTVVG